MPAGPMPRADGEADRRAHVGVELGHELVGAVQRAGRPAARRVGVAVPAELRTPTRCSGAKVRTSLPVALWQLSEDQTVSPGGVDDVQLLRARPDVPLAGTGRDVLDAAASTGTGTLPPVIFWTLGISCISASEHDVRRRRAGVPVGSGGRARRGARRRRRTRRRARRRSAPGRLGVAAGDGLAWRWTSVNAAVGTLALDAPAPLHIATSSMTNASTAPNTIARRRQ